MGLRSFCQAADPAAWALASGGKIVITTAAAVRIPSASMRRSMRLSFCAYHDVPTIWGYNASLRVVPPSELREVIRWISGRYIGRNDHRIVPPRVQDGVVGVGVVETGHRSNRELVIGREAGDAETRIHTRGSRPIFTHLQRTSFHQRGAVLPLGERQEGPRRVRTCGYTTAACAPSGRRRCQDMECLSISGKLPVCSPIQI